MPIITDEAIVLRLTDYSESSQIATLLTARYGLTRLIAKGARRGNKQRPPVGLDLLELGDAGFSQARGEAGLGALTEWQQLDAFLELRHANETLYAALYAAELTPAITVEHDPAPLLFDALRNLFRALNGQHETNVFQRVTQFQAAALRSLGQAPNLRECVECGRARPRGRPAFFSALAGGLLCSNCAPRHAERLRLRGQFLDAAGDAPAHEWFQLLDYHLRHIAGRAFASSDMLRRLS